MNQYAKQRDKCERAIIEALEAVGATVSQLSGKGQPDLLVGYQRKTHLLECKDPVMGTRNSRSGSGKKVSNDLGIRESQWKWWTKWGGSLPVVVSTPDEALAAIGAVK